MDIIPFDVLRELLFSELFAVHYWVLCSFVCKHWQKICSPLIKKYFAQSCCFRPKPKSAMVFAGKDAIIYSLYVECNKNVIRWFDAKLKCYPAIGKHIYLQENCIRLAAINGYVEFLNSVRNVPSAIVVALPWVAFGGNMDLFMNELAKQAELPLYLKMNICKRAARGAQYRLLKWLMDVEGWTIDFSVLLRAAKSGSVELFMFLWESKPNVQYTRCDSREQLLHWALKSDTPEMLTALEDCKIVTTTTDLQPYMLSTVVGSGYYYHSFQWLYKNAPDYVKRHLPNAIALASGCGSVRILQYIHDNIVPVPCYEDKLQTAIRIHGNKRRIV